MVTTSPSGGNTPGHLRDTGDPHTGPNCIVMISITAVWRRGGESWEDKIVIRHHGRLWPVAALLFGEQLVPP